MSMEVRETMNILDITDMGDMELDALFANAAKVAKAMGEVGTGPADFIDAWEAAASVTAPAVARARAYKV